MKDRDALILDHFNLVDVGVATAPRMYGVGASREDDHQDGMIGLIRAADLYDPTNSTPFAGFALLWIRWSIQRGRGNRMGVSYRSARSRGELHIDPLSLDAPRREDDGPSIADTLDEGSSESFRRCPSVDVLLSLLTEADAIAILNPSREAAAMLGIKRTSVLKRRVRAYDRLRREVAA